MLDDAAVATKVSELLVAESDNEGRGLMLLMPPNEDNEDERPELVWLFIKEVTFKGELSKLLATVLVDVRVGGRLSGPVIRVVADDTDGSELDRLFINEATFDRELRDLLAIVLVDARATVGLLGRAIGYVVENAKGPELARLLNNDIWGSILEPRTVIVIVLVGLRFTMVLLRLPVDVGAVSVYMASFDDVRGFTA